LWLAQASKLIPIGAVLAKTCATQAQDEQGKDQACEVVDPPRDDPAQTLDPDESEAIRRFRDTLPW
jgi:hypothetical protein